MRKIYHYTTIDSLAMIMSSRSIKFNRLDKVDDMEERKEPSNYIFVSCWTEYVFVKKPEKLAELKKLENEVWHIYDALRK